jgi:hypothetical protein
MVDEPNWVTALRCEFEAMEPLDQITAAAAWTTIMTNETLGYLGDARRKAVVQVINSWGGPKEISRLAETLGTRANVVQRLWEEGKKISPSE